MQVRDEVCRYGADIICLQECDAFNAILTALRKSGESQVLYGTTVSCYCLVLLYRTAFRKKKRNKHQPLMM